MASEVPVKVPSQIEGVCSQMVGICPRRLFLLFFAVVGLPISVRGEEDLCTRRKRGATTRV